MEILQAIEGLYEVRNDGQIRDVKGKLLKQYACNGGDTERCVSIMGKDGVRRHVPVALLLAHSDNSIPFDTGVEPSKQHLCANNSRSATNDELVKRQIDMISPILHRTDEDYLKSLYHLLKAGLGNRRVSY